MVYNSSRVKSVNLIVVVSPLYVTFLFKSIKCVILFRLSISTMTYDPENID